MTVENTQRFFPGDKVIDLCKNIWTIKQRDGHHAPIMYNVVENEDSINQIDIVRKIN